MPPGSSLLRPKVGVCFNEPKTEMRRVFVIGAVAFVPALAAAQAGSTRTLLDQYCVTCHNQKLKIAGLLLDQADPARAGDQAELWEKVIRKLRAGMMPPLALPRPEPAAVEQAA